MSDIVTNFDAIIDDEKEEGLAKLEQSTLIMRGSGIIQGIRNSKEEEFGTFEWYSVDKVLTIKLNSCTAENTNYTNIKLISRTAFPAKSSDTKCTTIGYYPKTKSSIPVELIFKVEDSFISISLLNTETINSDIISAILYRWFIIQLN